jgi:hypothetical protein
MLFQTGEEYSNLDLTGAKHNNNKLAIVNKRSSNPITGRWGPEDSGEVKASRFRDIGTRRW